HHQAGEVLQVAQHFQVRVGDLVTVQVDGEGHVQVGEWVGGQFLEDETGESGLRVWNRNGGVGASETDVVGGHLRPGVLVRLELGGCRPGGLFRVVGEGECARDE